MTATPAELDPLFAQMLEGIAASGMGDGLTSMGMSVTQLRAVLQGMALQARLGPDGAPVAGVEDTVVGGAEGDLPARIYRPDTADAAVPTLVFFHGGGFVIGDLETHDDVCRLLCSSGEMVVVSVDYRLAPEHPFPAAPQDALAATRWCHAHVGDLGGDPSRLAAGGDSAGGNLAAVVAQQLNGTDTPVAAQLLIYPAVDQHADREWASGTENATGYYLTRTDIDWFGHQYAADPDSPLASPLLQPLTGLPPAVVGTAGFDPLRDMGDAYAEALTAAGVTVVHRPHPSLIHGFVNFAVISPLAKHSLEAMGRDLAALMV